MYSHYLDALAICRVLGNPQFFITFTCNVKWPEIQRYMAEFPHLTTVDRAYIVCRVFFSKILNHSWHLSSKGEHLVRSQEVCICFFINLF